MIDQIIEYNKTFVAQKGYEKYLTDKYLIKMNNILFALAAMIVWAACGNKQAVALAEGDEVNNEVAFEHEKLETIALAGINAPSAMNRQNWAVRIIEDQKLSAIPTSCPKPSLAMFRR